MTYEYITKHTSPNQSGRRPMKVKTITIHHWGIDGQDFDNVVRYLCRSNGNSSAHYVAEHQKVACVVDPDNIAWHAGVWARNQDSIGIECRPEATDGDYETVAELIAKIRAEYGNLPLKRHKDWKATACPGRWDIKRLDRMADAIARGDKPKAEEKPKGDSKPAKQPARKRLRVDGKWGKATTERLQEVLDAPFKDGEISRQNADWRDANPGLTTGWEWMSSGYGEGSQTIERLQKVVGVKQDGLIGPKTIAALQRHLARVGAYDGATDGEIWRPSTTVKAMQRRLNDNKF